MEGRLVCLTRSYQGEKAGEERSDENKRILITNQYYSFLFPAAWI